MLNFLLVLGSASSLREDGYNRRTERDPSPSTIRAPRLLFNPQLLKKSYKIPLTNDHNPPHLMSPLCARFDNLNQVMTSQILLRLCGVFPTTMRVKTTGEDNANSWSAFDPSFTSFSGVEGAKSMGSSSCIRVISGTTSSRWMISSSPCQLQQSPEHTTHLPPPFMAYNNGRTTSTVGMSADIRQSSKPHHA